MSCDDDVRILTVHGYIYNGYVGWWQKRNGYASAEILVLSLGGALLNRYYCGRRVAYTKDFGALSDAIEVGDKWLEACDAE